MCYNCYDVLFGVFFGGHFMGHVFYEKVARRCRWDGQKPVGFIHVFFRRTVGQISRPVKRTDFITMAPISADLT